MVTLVSYIFLHESCKCLCKKMKEISTSITNGMHAQKHMSLYDKSRLQVSSLTRLWGEAELDGGGMRTMGEKDIQYNRCLSGIKRAADLCCQRSAVLSLDNLRHPPPYHHLITTTNLMGIFVDV